MKNKKVLNSIIIMYYYQCFDFQRQFSETSRLTIIIHVKYSLSFDYLKHKVYKCIWSEFIYIWFLMRQNHTFKPILKIRRKKSKKGKIIVLFLLDNTRMDEIARSSSQLSIGIIGNNCEGIIIRFKLIFKWIYCHSNSTIKLIMISF